MKTKTRRNRPASIAKTRWAAYAAAGAATALVGGKSAEAAIHYSGLLHERFLPGEDHEQVFQLVDQTGVSLFFEHLEDIHLAACSLIGGSINSTYYELVKKWSFGQYISAFFFWRPNSLRTMVSDRVQYTYQGYKWGHPGTGFVGFRFDTGAGLQYGWVRVKMTGRPENAFRVVDYAYADPGEPITAGQRKSGQQSNADQSPDQGSLGWLALGGAGLLAWRRQRSVR